jgi:hypothetical protein
VQLRESLFGIPAALERSDKVAGRAAGTTLSQTQARLFDK